MQEGVDNNKYDLIIIDGGKGQLSQGIKVLKDLGLKNQDVVSLAKRLEEIFVPYQKNPVILPYSSPALFFFQKIRDEAHRFAISFHRKLRETQALESILDNIPYLGKTRKKKLCHSPLVDANPTLSYRL